jgi:hypothetical protein
MNKNEIWMMEADDCIHNYANNLDFIKTLTGNPIQS